MLYRTKLYMNFIMTFQSQNEKIYTVALIDEYTQLHLNIERDQVRNLRTKSTDTILREWLYDGIECSVKSRVVHCWFRVSLMRACPNIDCRDWIIHLPIIPWPSPHPKCICIFALTLLVERLKRQDCQKLLDISNPWLSLCHVMFSSFRLSNK